MGEAASPKWKKRKGIPPVEKKVKVLEKSHSLAFANTTAEGRATVEKTISHERIKTGERRERSTPSPATGEEKGPDSKETSGTKREIIETECSICPPTWKKDAWIHGLCF